MAIRQIVIICPIRLISKSGLDGLSATDDYLSTYYTKDPKDEAALKQFRENIKKADVALGKNDRGVKEGVDRFWNYGLGAIPYKRISGDFRPP